jgi:beta-1,4-mannosyl-glycoprotein beta-1,4-N-acetylglucosaminyltransferase
MSNVYDCLMFFAETDMLELRVKELQHVVDYHVVCESRETHSGKPKELNFDKLYKRLPAHLQSKMIYVVVDELSDGVRDSWQREYYHRSCISRGLVNAQPDDLVIVSDCDEIVNPDVIPHIKDKAGITMDLYYYNFNTRMNEFWGVGASRWGLYSDVNGIRTNAMGGEQLIGGWHLSYAGNTEFIAEKLRSFMHFDYAEQVGITSESISHALKNRTDLFRRAGVTLSYLPTGNGEHLPKTVQNDMKHYRVLGWLE